MHSDPAEGSTRDSTRAAQPAPVLPAQYYLDHFNEILTVIGERYEPVLEPRHREFIDQFKALPRPARCLYIRMLNRRGTVFDSSRFSYQEIEDIPVQVDTLLQSRFIRRVTVSDVDAWLPVLSKDRLLSLIGRQCSPDSYRRSWSKAALLEFALHILNRSHPEMQGAMQCYVMQLRTDQVGYLLFLYFGRFEQSLSRFTLRDLGVMHGNKFDSTREPRFHDRNTALNTWFYCRTLGEIKNLPATDEQEIVEKITHWPETRGEQAWLLRQQAIYQLGEQAERYGNKTGAEQIYAQATGWPASERRIRLLYGRGERDQARQMLENIIGDPDCDEEMLFAEDFYARKYRRKRTSKVTDLLRSGETLDVDESYRDMPEQGVAEILRNRGAAVFHTENRLWKTLFGLLFWGLLFEHDKARIYNNFEKRPADLDNGRFYQRFENEINGILDGLSDTRRTIKTLVATIGREYGKPNGIFHWHSHMLDELQLFLPVAPVTAVAAILRRMCQDFTGNRSGYPDLLVIEDNVARFVEVKAEGDQLRRNQLKQFVAMGEAGFPIAINRIRWAVNPHQVYVVVDIETTGRRSASNRITELAGIRMQNGKVIDTWQSLINPCRSIPSGITTLTGITDKMVGDAPLFPEIADSFRRFSEDAIFVAHNAGFDYGFIRDEYQRLEQFYQRPTLCSCIQMRKWYPGLKSYSLKNLCDEFGIELESHHRAMCDALAAGELLNLINERRLSSAV